MTSAVGALEQRLLQDYEVQLRHYERALAILAQEPAAVITHDGWVHDLHKVLHDLAALDRAMKDDKRAWRSSGKTPGAELSALLKRLAERIRMLAEGIDWRMPERTWRPELAG